jgi:HEAT repeat protein
VSPEEHARLLREALQSLETPDPLAIESALTSLRELRGRAAAEGIMARLRAGLPPQLAELAIEVLGNLEQPLAAPVLSELTLHRRWQVRAQAVAALGALRVRSTESVLLFALDDPSPEVRAAAADALGLVGGPRSLPALTTALERGVNGALVALARIGSQKQVDLVLTRAQADLRGSEPALWALLTRPSLSAANKTKLIKLVQEQNSDESRQVLARWQAQLREAGDFRLLGALEAHTPAAPHPKSSVPAATVAAKSAAPAAQAKAVLP